jgi:hypothetical protein
VKRAALLTGVFVACVAGSVGIVLFTDGRDPVQRTLGEAGRLEIRYLSAADSMAPDDQVMVSLSLPYASEASVVKRFTALRWTKVEELQKDEYGLLEYLNCVLKPPPGDSSREVAVVPAEGENVSFVFFRKPTTWERWTHLAKGLIGRE